MSYHVLGQVPWPMYLLAVIVLALLSAAYVGYIAKKNNRYLDAADCVITAFIVSIASLLWPFTLFICIVSAIVYYIVNMGEGK